VASRKSSKASNKRDKQSPPVATYNLYDISKKSRAESPKSARSHKSPKNNQPQNTKASSPRILLHTLTQSSKRSVSPKDSIVDRKVQKVNLQKNKSLKMFKTPICIQSSFNHAKEEKKVASVQNKKPLKSQPNKSQQPRPYQPAKCRLNKDINLSKEESIEPR